LAWDGYRRRAGPAIRAVRCPEYLRLGRRPATTSALSAPASAPAPRRRCPPCLAAFV